MANPAPLKHKAEVTRSKEEALSILQGHLAYLKQKFSSSTAATAGSLDKAADAVCVSSAWNPLKSCLGGWRPACARAILSACCLHLANALATVEQKSVCHLSLGFRRFGYTRV